MRLLRQVRGELRLYAHRLVIGVLLLQTAVVVAALLAGQTYARDQVAIRGAPVRTCAEYKAMGVPPEECASSQAVHQESRDHLRAIAARVGPPGQASTTPPGVLALTVGHASTLVGLLALSLIAAVTLGAEREIGLARVRDTSHLAGRAGVVRCLGLITVWCAGTAIVGVAAVLVNELVATEVGWVGPADPRSTWQHLLIRSLGALLVVGVYACLLVSLRRLLTTRARTLAAGALVTVLLVAVGLTGHPYLLPSNAGWGVMAFERDVLSFIDRFPLQLTIDRTPPPALVGAVAVAVLALGAAVARATVHGNVRPSIVRPDGQRS